jgi:Flp pilus assembly protein TadG
LKGRDKGTVAVTFLLSLPILLTVIGVLVQYALLANAQLTLNRAVQAAARSAMTALPTDPGLGERGGPDFVRRSALMTLESLSPAAADVSNEGLAVADALEQVGENPPASYAARYNFAQQATQMDIAPLGGSGTDYPRMAAPRVRLTVQYDFLLTVPVLRDVVGRTDTVAGITGRFMRLTSSLDVQLSHGRQAPTNGAGVP